MRPRHAFSKTLFAPVAGFLLIVAMAFLSYWLSLRQDEASGWVQHSLRIEARLARVELLVTRAETGQRGFLLTGNRAYLAPYRSAMDQISTELQNLARATADNGAQEAAIQRLRLVVQAKLDELSRTVTLMDTGHSDQALRILRTDVGNHLMQRIVTDLATIGAREQALLNQRSRDAARVATRVRGLILASALAIILMAIWVLRDAYHRRLLLEATNRELRAQIQERNAAQAQVRQLQKMEAVGQLTGGIAHDFNNMLAIVMGNLEMAGRRLAGSEDARVRQCIENATEGAQRATTLTARLLAFSRQQPLEPKVLDTNKLVGSMSELLRRTLGEVIHVETVLAGGLWRVCADPGQLENTIVNLAVNARDAMPDGGRLTIETANCELDDRYARQHDEVEAGQYVMVSVSDTGIGMSADTVERAFEPFYTTKGVGKGTGLGLSQVFGFVKQSSGHIKIYSEIDQGTTIKIYLPRYVGAQASAAESACAPGPVPQGSPDEVVLVVEDEASVRHMSVDALRDLGYTVIQASGGNQALEQLTIQPRIDLLFTDIIMPDMNGRELAEQAAKLRPDLRILYTTGYTRNAVVHNGMVDHGIAFLAKPFSLEALAVKVRQVLDGER